MTRPCRLPVGARRVGVCRACGGETYLVRVEHGWRCDCGHVTSGRFPAPVRANRTIDVRRAIALCEAGHSYTRVAQLLGCSASSLRRALARSSFTPRLHGAPHGGPGSARRYVVPAELLDRYPELTVAEIAERAGCSFATAYRRVREHRDGQLAPREVWQRRAHVRRRSVEADARCAEALRMREAGAKWLEIAIALGYASDLHALKAVRAYRERGCAR